MAKPGNLPHINVRISEQEVEMRDDRDRLVGPARLEVDGRSNKTGRASGSFNLQFLQLQQKIQHDLKFMEAPIVETTLPAGAILRGSGWSIRGRERQKTEFTAKFTRSVDAPDYLVLEFTGTDIFVDANGPPRQVDRRSEAMDAITFKE